MTISRWILSRRRNVPDKSCGENQNIHFMFYQLSRKSCRLWDNVGKNMVETDSLRMTMTGRMCSAFWITKATNTHLEYIIRTDFPPQQWLRERAWMLRYTYIACLIRTHFGMSATRRLQIICDRSQDSPAIKHWQLRLSSSWCGNPLFSSSSDEGGGGGGSRCILRGPGVPVGDPGARLCCICFWRFGSVHAEGQFFA
jgi:hypothetical protein